MRKFIKRMRTGRGYGFGHMNLRGLGVPVDESGAPAGVFDLECPDGSARPLVFTFESRCTQSDEVILAISARFPKLLFGHLCLDECGSWVGWQVVHAGETLAGHDTNNLFDGGGLWEPVASDPIGHFHPSLGVHNGHEAISGNDWRCDEDVALLLDSIPRQRAKLYGLDDAVASIERMAQSGEILERLSEEVQILRADVECRYRFEMTAARLGLPGNCDPAGLHAAAKFFREVSEQPSTVEQLLKATVMCERLVRERREPPGPRSGP